MIPAAVLPQDAVRAQVPPGHRVKWTRKWVHQDTIVHNGKCKLLKWVREIVPVGAPSAAAMPAASPIADTSSWARQMQMQLQMQQMQLQLQMQQIAGRTQQPTLLFPSAPFSYHMQLPGTGQLLTYPSSPAPPQGPAFASPSSPFTAGPTYPPIPASLAQSPNLIAQIQAQLPALQGVTHGQVPRGTSPGAPQHQQPPGPVLPQRIVQQLQTIGTPGHAPLAAVPRPGDRLSLQAQLSEAVLAASSTPGGPTQLQAGPTESLTQIQQRLRLLQSSTLAPSQPRPALVMPTSAARSSPLQLPPLLGTSPGPALSPAPPPSRDAAVPPSLVARHSSPAFLAERGTRVVLQPSPGSALAPAGLADPGARPMEPSLPLKGTDGSSRSPAPGPLLGWATAARGEGGLPADERPGGAAVPPQAAEPGGGAGGGQLPVRWQSSAPAAPEPRGGPAASEPGATLERAAQIERPLQDHGAARQPGSPPVRVKSAPKLFDLEVAATEEEPDAGALPFPAAASLSGKGHGAVRSRMEVDLDRPPVAEPGEEAHVVAANVDSAAESRGQSLYQERGPHATPASTTSRKPGFGIVDLNESAEDDRTEAGQEDQTQHVLAGTQTEPWQAAAGSTREARETRPAGERGMGPSSEASLKVEARSKSAQGSAPPQAAPSHRGYDLERIPDPGSPPEARHEAPAQAGAAEAGMEDQVRPAMVEVGMQGAAAKRLRGAEDAFAEPAAGAPSYAGPVWAGVLPQGEEGGETRQLLRAPPHSSQEDVRTPSEAGQEQRASQVHSDAQLRVAAQARLAPEQSMLERTPGKGGPLGIDLNLMQDPALLAGSVSPGQAHLPHTPHSLGAETPDGAQGAGTPGTQGWAGEGGGAGEGPDGLPMVVLLPPDSFVCRVEGCGKAFADAGSLRKHSHVHGERQYVCHYEGCGKKFVDSSKLKRHFLIHTGEKRFICPYEGCGKAFSLDFNRRSHMRTHTGENYHTCPVLDCGKRFAHESKLRAHIATVHDKSPGDGSTRGTPGRGAYSPFGDGLDRMDLDEEDDGELALDEDEGSAPLEQDEEHYDRARPKGERGDRGESDRGERGERGEKGKRGDKGDRGERGEKLDKPKKRKRPVVQQLLMGDLRAVSDTEVESDTMENLPLGGSALTPEEPDQQLQRLSSGGRERHEDAGHEAHEADDMDEEDLPLSMAAVPPRPRTTPGSAKRDQRGAEAEQEGPDEEAPPPPSTKKAKKASGPKPSARASGKEGGEGPSSAGHGSGRGSSGGTGGVAPAPPDAPRNFVCPHEGCSKAYLHEYKLNLHLRTAHGEDAPPPDPKAALKARKRAAKERAAAAAAAAADELGLPAEPSDDAENRPLGSMAPKARRPKAARQGGAGRARGAGSKARAVLSGDALGAEEEDMDEGGAGDLGPSFFDSPGMDGEFEDAARMEGRQRQGFRAGAKRGFDLMSLPRDNSGGGEEEGEEDYEGSGEEAEVGEEEDGEADEEQEEDGEDELGQYEEEGEEYEVEMLEGEEDGEGEEEDEEEEEDALLDLRQHY